MSVPKKRLSKTRTRKRRSHHGVDAVQTQTCEKCQNPVQPHMACPSCGHYKGRDVLQKQAAVERKIAKETAAEQVNTDK